MTTPLGGQRVPDDGQPMTFWGEIAPSEQLDQLYEDHGAILDALERFVADGLEAGDGVIVVVTGAHLAALSDRLLERAIDPALACARDQYVAFDVEDILPQFMVKGWPDQDLFEAVVTGLIGRARGPEGRRVRAFGELVAVLWGQGLSGATVHLEHLWSTLCERGGFSLMCAYPKSGFTQTPETSIREICDAHSRLLAS